MSAHDLSLEYAEDHPWRPEPESKEDAYRDENDYDEVVYSAAEAAHFLNMWQLHLAAHPNSKLAVKEIAAWEGILADARNGTGNV